MTDSTQLFFGRTLSLDKELEEFDHLSGNLFWVADGVIIAEPSKQFRVIPHQLIANVSSPSLVGATYLVQ